MLYLAVLLAGRFGGTPMDYWRAPAQERERLLEMFSVEGEVAEAYRGLAAGDEVVFVDDD